MIFVPSYMAPKTMFGIKIPRTLYNNILDRKLLTSFVVNQFDQPKWLIEFRWNDRKNEIITT